MTTQDARREDLLEALDLAEAANPRDVEHYAALRTQALEDAQDPRHLGQLEVALLRYFRETIGPEVDAFWEGVEDAGLPYSRPNLVGKVLCRGHLRAHEYDVFAEGLSHLEGSGQLSEGEARSLAAFLDAYEASHAHEFED